MHSRRFVIGDIHGCYHTFRTMVEERIGLTKSDRLYLVGDNIDRGLDSIGVVESIMQQMEDGFQLFPIRGNHEQYAVEAYENWDPEKLNHISVPSNKQLIAFLSDEKLVQEKYYDFFRKLPFYYDLGDFIIVHAGIKFNSEKPFEEYLAMTELRKTVPDFSILGNKRIIAGHQVTNISDIRRMVEQKEVIIIIDNGCSYTKPHKRFDYTQLGSLCALNLNTFELLVQKNVELNINIISLYQVKECDK